jgi:hypothetical protein
MPLARHQGPTDRADHAGRDGSRETERTSDRYHELADSETVRIAQLGSRETAAVDPEERQIGQRIATGYLERRLGPVGERSDPAWRPSHDMGGGQEVPVRCEDDAGTGAVRFTLARTTTDTQLDDARQQMLGDRGDDRRVRVERVGVVRLVAWRFCPRRSIVGEPDDVVGASHDSH